MTLKTLLQIFSDKNCDIIYAKELSPNDNSKNQIYVAEGNTRVLNLFPTDDFVPITSGKRKEISFHASPEFYWVDEDGIAYNAPHAKFILYPDYPEVRFSGFLRGCKKPPTTLLANNRDIGRVLFLAVSKEGKIFGYVSAPESEISKEIIKRTDFEKDGFFKVLNIDKKIIIKDPKAKLLGELKRIYEKGWINSKQLKPGFIVAPCNESRCGGLTLEAELGIIQNGRSEPDLLGWEIKQFGVKKIHLINSSRITLMTPEPDGGIYKDRGGIEFVKKFGYKSLSIVDRMDFTGYHKYGKIQPKSELTLNIDGYDTLTSKITDATGGIYLSNIKGVIAASWSFSKMLTHWNKKHAKAAYVPSLLNTNPVRQYKYSHNVLLGEGTDFSYFINNIANGKVFYDPGIHVDTVSSGGKLKPRSQFRISSKHISTLYDKTEIIDLNKV